MIRLTVVVENTVSMPFLPGNEPGMLGGRDKKLRRIGIP